MSLRQLGIAFTIGLTLVLTTALQARPQVPEARPEVAGVRNFTRIDATMACGGAFGPDAAAAVARAGYRSVVNLRVASEPGASVEEEAKAVRAAGLVYIHLPFAHSAPDAAAVDEFLKLVADPANKPMLVHCASGARASLLWAIKRVMIDGWPVDKAMNELPDLAARVAQPLRDFALEYLKAHGRLPAGAE